MAFEALHVNFLTSEGGAARAAARIHQSIKNHGNENGWNSSFRAFQGTLFGPDVNVSYPATQSFFWRKIRPYLTRFRRRNWKTQNPVLHSVAWPDTGLGQELQEQYANGEFDVLNLHWIGDNTISIEEIGRLKCPLVWTLHDQWPFCGAEHYSYNLPGSDWDSSSSCHSDRYANAYSKDSCPVLERRNDLNRKTWLRKYRAWRKQITLVCSSQWMLDCVTASSLFHSCPASIIPIPIDVEEWKPMSQLMCRDFLHLPKDKKLILFGAVDALRDPRKGSDLLLEALKNLAIEDSFIQSQVELVIFGQSAPQSPLDVGFKVYYLGHLFDDISLQMAYSACDVMVVPSRQEAFGQTASEASACGLPVVAFAATGLLDVVDDCVSGKLAQPFDPKSLAKAIRWVLADEDRRLSLSFSARQRAERLWNYQRVSKMYSEVYRESCLNNLL